MAIRNRPTYLESLQESNRNCLLDLSLLVQQDPNRIKVLGAKPIPIVEPNNIHEAVQGARAANNGSLYMKSIWQLRRRINEITVENESNKEKLASSEERRRMVESDLCHSREQHSLQIRRLAEQVEELINRGDTAEAVTREALEREQKGHADRQIAEDNARVLRQILMTDLEKPRASPEMNSAWKKLITPELVRQSEPPRDFPQPVAVPFTTAEFVNMKMRLKKVKTQRDELLTNIEEMTGKYEQIQKDHHEKVKAYQVANAQLSNSLTGSARRIQWLLDERNKAVNKLRATNQYTAKLEKQILRQHHDLQRIKGGSGARKAGGQGGQRPVPVVDPPPRNARTVADRGITPDDDDQKTGGDTGQRHQPQPEPQSVPDPEGGPRSDSGRTRPTLSDLVRKAIANEQ